MGTGIRKKLTARGRRRLRGRQNLTGTAERPRLNVFRSAKHIYAQLIDDTSGKTLATASTLGKDAVAAAGDKTARAKAVGAKVAELGLAHSISRVVFDRNGYRYHGRVRAVAEAARAAGLQF